MKLNAMLATFLVVVLGLPCLSSAGMASTNYRITTTVMSGGGGVMASSNYRLTGTLGQPSPLIDPADPPYSASFDLLTGFWYTLGAGVGCLWDIEPSGVGDGDVDGADLAAFIDIFDLADVGAFAAEFGRENCF